MIAHHYLWSSKRDDALTIYQLASYQQVISKLCLLLDNYGCNEALVMLSHLEHRMRTKQARVEDQMSTRHVHCTALAVYITFCRMAMVIRIGFDKL